MHRIFTLILLLGCIVPAFADECSAPAMQEPHATLVIYRHRTNEAGFRRASIYVDEQKICSLTNGRYLILHIAAGRHKIRSSDSTHGAEGTFKAGLVYYFLVHVIPMGKHTKELRNFWSLDPVPACQADAVVQVLKPQDGEKKPLPIVQKKEIEDMGVPEAPAS